MDEVEDVTELVGEHCDFEVTAMVFIGDDLGVEEMSRCLASSLEALARLVMGTRAMGWFRPNCFLNPSSMVSLRVWWWCLDFCRGSGAGFPVALTGVAIRVPAGTALRDGGVGGGGGLLTGFFLGLYL